MRTVTQDRLGGPEVLRVVDTDPPQPLPTEALVEVHASSMNHIDTLVRQGDFPMLGEPPFVLGWDVSGVVAEISPASATTLRPGDEVFGMPLFPREAGAHAELVAAPARHFASKPAGLTHPEAAALPLAGLTAWQALVDTAEVRPGQRVLVHGGGGGVGHLAVQILKALGAEVITTASGPKHEWLHKLGANQTIDHRTEDFTEATSDIDVVFDTVGGNGPRSFDVLRSGGLLVTIVDHFDQDLARAATDRGLRMAGVAVEPDRRGLEGLVDLVDRGLLRPHIQETHQLDQIADAHGALAAGGLTGKVVVTMQP